MVLLYIGRIFLIQNIDERETKTQSLATLGWHWGPLYYHDVQTATPQPERPGLPGPTDRPAAEPPGPGLCRHRPCHHTRGATSQAARRPVSARAHTAATQIWVKRPGRS